MCSLCCQLLRVLDVIGVEVEVEVEAEDKQRENRRANLPEKNAARAHSSSARYLW